MSLNDLMVAAGGIGLKNDSYLICIERSSACRVRGPGQGHRATGNVKSAQALPGAVEICGAPFCHQSSTIFYRSMIATAS